MLSSAKKQRLALFLDGTWNTEDDSTNVRNAYHLTLEGEMPDGYYQKRYYDRGVGTGMLLDGLTGGGLGWGLETNVRQAYNWLADHYNDGDEVYIFGFSRGAYTARSLVGLIAACGLIRRGAPLTVTQLWEGYGFISRNREKQKNEWWEKVFAKQPDLFRRINWLMKDEWKEEDKWVIRKPLNETEKLLRQWSRRIQITYLGVFDTVGAMGIHALGIPGLKSRLAASHNQSPTRILKSCRHALAVDENRTSFRLTPILNFVPHRPRKNFEDYKNVILQRWFIGAHSNVGGGYTNNTFSLRPFEWIIEGAKEAHLHLLPFPEVDDEAKRPPSSKKINDSYSGFVGLIWPHFLREKRYHRPIGRAAKVRAGYSLVTVHEDIDESVYQWLQASPTYAPPNLLSYIRRSGDVEKKQILAGRKALQKWPGDRLTDDLKGRLISRLALIAWAALAALGLFNILQFFWVDPFPISVLGVSLLAAFYVLVDWGEARATLETALYPEAVIPRVTWNVLFWMRLLGLLAFTVGLLLSVGAVAQLAWGASITLLGIKTFFIDLWNLLQAHLLFSLLTAGATVLLLDALGPYFSFQTKVLQAKDFEGVNFDIEKKKEKRKEPKLIVRLASLIAVLGFVWSYRHFMTGEFATAAVDDVEALAGKFLLLQLLLISFVFIAGWVSKPMSRSRANLGGMLQLQQLYHPAQLRELLNDWSQKMKRYWVAPKQQEALAWLRTRQVVRIALWRDILGFVPMYSFVFLLALYLGSEMGWCFWAGMDGAKLVGGMSWFLYLIFGVAVLDEIENTIHLRYLDNHSKGGSSTGLFYFGLLITLLKLIAFTTAALMTLVIFVGLAYEILRVDSGGWRWTIAVITTYLSGIAFLVFGLKNISVWMRKRKKKKEKS